MGEVQGTLFALECNRSVVIEARPDRVTADAGVLLMRELSQKLGLPGLVAKHLDDPRDPDKIVHPFLELVRTRLFTLIQGWGDQNDVALLHADPALRLAVSERRGDRPLRTPDARLPEGLCSQPTLSRLQHTLASDENRTGLAHILRAIVRPFLGLPREEATVDLDSLPQVVHGHQPGSAYNRHYGVRCYHPVVASIDERFFLGARLRSGNVHTADGGLDFVLPILRWLRSFIPSVWLRADAGFPEPRFLDTLEDEDIPYICRLRSNAVLQRLAAPHLRRPPGRPPAEGRTWFHELIYQARSWRHPRRVVLVVVEHPGEQQHLFLDHFFLLTNALPEEASAEALLERYRRRGSAEADFGDCNTALAPALSSSPRPKSNYRSRPVHRSGDPPDCFAANEVQLLLCYLAANLMAAGAELLQRKGRARMSRERFRTFLLKTAARALFGSRQVTVVIDAARAPLWQRFHQRLLALPLPRGSPDLGALPTPA
jgi:hypothetical protein